MVRACSCASTRASRSTPGASRPRASSGSGDLRGPTRTAGALVESSYNAGLGWILKAQALCDNAALWDGIMKCLPAITGEHSKETIGYTLRIRRIWAELKGQ
jgi:hypothetical protein